jgi:hypothetical protein
LKLLRRANVSLWGHFIHERIERCHVRRRFNGYDTAPADMIGQEIARGGK